MRLNQVTVGCIDYAASVDFYTRIGLTQIVDSPPDYARFETPTGETFSIHAVDAVGHSTTIVYFETESLDQEVYKLKEAGLTFHSDPADRRWGWREARLRDPAGNEICLFHGGKNRRFPDWRIDTNTKD